MPHAPSLARQLLSDWGRAREQADLCRKSHADMHAGAIETSILLHADPDLARPGYEAANHYASEHPFLLTPGMRECTKSETIGFPSHTTSEKAHTVPAGLTASFANHLNALGA
ncbi:creatininase family protein [Streptomyces sp. NPDC059355]|uniref:creatininase family protein n=1 Tax=Streptomyces sp. NPDC059355 TaxID=3346811 RepID=UPI0036B5BD1D